MTAPAPCDEDLYERCAAGLHMPERLPRDLYEALAALKRDSYLRAQLGEAFCTQFLQLKQQEWDHYQQQVSAWELARYADAF
jgi:glutamine synthetase